MCIPVYTTYIQNIYKNIYTYYTLFIYNIVHVNI